MVSNINSVFWVSLLATLFIAEGIDQPPQMTERIPLKVVERVTAGFRHNMSRGSLSHVQTISFKSSKDDEDLGPLSSFIVNANGTQLLAISRTGSFVEIDLNPTGVSELDVTSADVLVNVLTEIDPGDVEGLTINGVYEGNGKGELYSYIGKPQDVVVKLHDGTIGEKTIHDLNGCQDNGGVKSLLKLHSIDGSGLLLLACKRPFARGESEGDYLFPVYFYSDTLSGEAKSFIVKAPGHFEPTDMAELSSGDIIVLFRRFNRGRKAMRVECIAAESLRQAMSTGSVVMSETMATWREKDKLPLGRPEALAVRQDPVTKKEFVYILAQTMNGSGDDDEEKPGSTTSISMYEWEPIVIGPRLPDEPCFSDNAAELYTMTALWIAVVAAFSAYL
ncbi:hypothetical protein FOL47_003947 [Perkinsus chesapeaki]|uniref:Uncharacterized protein n=1 Tax=Perkinsus chesapeaki TaxID=330153 RepID=A0A7J6M6K5_PERCH|nr:hypothetical protein FOL47_003947 [Perkinsus chesapeaki]